MKTAAVYCTGPEADIDRYGEEIPVWNVWDGDEDGERVPDVQIRHAGGATYNIWVRTGGKVPHYHSEGEWTNTDCFTRYPTHDGCGCRSGSYETCATHAEQAATDHFDAMVAEGGVV